MKRKETDLTQEIYFRLYNDNYTENKIESVREYYKNTDNLYYLLNDIEIDFLKNNLSKSNITTNYLTRDLTNIGILVDNQEGYKEVNIEHLDNIKKSLSDIDIKRTLENEYNKRCAYILVGILRSVGAYNFNQLYDYLNNQIIYNDEFKNIDDFINNLNHPYFKRFIKAVPYKKKMYYMPIELDPKERDLTFTKYQSNISNVPKTDINVLENIGKYYLNINSSIYNALTKNIKFSVLFNQLDRSTFVCLCGQNYFISDLFFKNHELDDFTDAELNMFDDFIRLMPSFVPVYGNTLHWDAYTYKGIVKYTNNFYMFAREYYNFKEEISNESFEKLFKIIVKDKLKVIKEYATYEKSKDLMEEHFKNCLVNSVYHEFDIFEERNNGLLIAKPKCTEFIACKLPLSNLHKLGRLKYIKCKMLIMNFTDHVVITTCDFIRDLNEEEIIDIKKRFKKGNIIYKLKK